MRLAFYGQTGPQNAYTEKSPVGGPKNYFCPGKSRLKIGQPLHRNNCRPAPYHNSQGLCHHRHMMGVGVQQGDAVDHDADMTGEKDNIAAFKYRIIAIGGNQSAQRSALLVAIAWAFYAGSQQGDLYQSGAIKAQR